MTDVQLRAHRHMNMDTNTHTHTNTHKKNTHRAVRCPVIALSRELVQLVRVVTL